MYLHGPGPAHCHLRAFPDHSFSQLKRERICLRPFQTGLEAEQSAPTTNISQTQEDSRSSSLEETRRCVGGYVGGWMDPGQQCVYLVPCALFCPLSLGLLLTSTLNHSLDYSLFFVSYCFQPAPRLNWQMAGWVNGWASRGTDEWKDG